MKKKVVLVLLIVCCAMTACAKNKGRYSEAVDSLAESEEIITQDQFNMENTDHIYENISSKDYMEIETQPTSESSPASIDEVYVSEDCYSICTSYSKKEVEDFAKQVKTAIMDGDSAGLAKMLSYPICIGGIDYSDADHFYAAVPEFNRDFIDKVSQLETTNLFCNWQGVMLGEGEVWIAEVLNDHLDSQGLKVIGINME